MALFSFGKDKKEEGNPDLVLAYLEDAQRQKSPFHLVDTKGREIPALVQSIDETQGQVAFQPSGALMAAKDDRIHFTFIHDGIRIGGRGRLVELRSGLVVLRLPRDLELQERRKKPRARLNPREGATLTALTSLFEGVGISGVLESLSEGGARVKVERALEAKGERKLNIATGLFPIGHAFMIVKLAKLPRTSSPLELGGKVIYMDSASGLSVGIAFTDPSAEVLSTIKSVVSQKVGNQPNSLPPKARRSKEAPPPQEARPDTPRNGDAPPPAPVAGVSPVPPSAAPAATPAPPAEPMAASPSSEAAPAPERNPALIRLKKRSRTLVLAMEAGPARDMLVEHLQEEGYGKVLGTGTLTELLTTLQTQTVALVFIDGGVAELQGMELAEALQKVGEAHVPLVLAAEEISTATVLAARRSGVDKLMVKPYALDAALTTLFEEQLGLA